MRKSSLVLVVIAFLAGSTNAPADDQSIVQQIRDRLAAKQQAGELKNFNINIRVQEGTVWMEGSVSNNQQRMGALSVAQYVPGVKQVVNDLSITPNNETAAIQQATPIGPWTTAQPGLVRERLQGSKRALVQALARLKPKGTQRISQNPARRSLPGILANRSQAEGTSVATGQAEIPGPQRTSGRRQRRLVPFLKKIAQLTTRTPVSGPPQQQLVPANAERTAARQPVPAAAPISIAAMPTNASLSVQQLNATSQTQTATTQPSAQSAPAQPSVQQQVAVTQKQPPTTTTSIPITQGPRQAAATQVMAAATATTISVRPPLQRRAEAIPVIPVATAVTIPVVPPRSAGRTSMIPVAFAPAGLAVRQAGAIATPVAVGRPDARYIPVDANGVSPARYDHPTLPAHAWPSYASYPNYGALTYPQQYSASAWPYIGPFYPYPQVPLGWRKVTLEWDDGWWFLDFKSK